MDAPAAHPAWAVYLLVADDGATYVGATVDLEHRLRQHNGQIGGGAKATHVRVARGQTWRRHCYVSGFPDNHAALQFEWRWKSLSRVVQRQMATQGLEPLERRLEALQRPDEALEAYCDVLNDLPTTPAATTQPPDDYWFHRAGGKALHLLEKAGKIEEAIEIAKKMAKAPGPRGHAAAELVDELALKYGVWSPRP
jgi:structure-specific endonuclease subunit SLX1